MTTYRTQLKIVADILLAAKDFGNAGDGVGVTTILRKANLPYSRLVRILKDLVGSGLLTTIEQERGSRYKISERGNEFLKVYTRFEEFSQSYGLRL